MEQVKTQTERGIIDLVGHIREQQVIIEQAEQSIKTAKEQLAILLEDYGKNWEDGAGGFARMIAEGTRTSYDTDALDELILKDPLHYGWLKDYRKQSSTSARVAVR